MKNPERIKDWELIAGALWVLPNGETYPVRGFHKEWLLEYPSLTNGLSESTDVILQLHWLSVVMLAQGQLELCVDDLDRSETQSAIRTLLLKNEGKWHRCLVISMSEDGFVRFNADEFASNNDLAALFADLRARRALQ